MSFFRSLHFKILCISVIVYVAALLRYKYLDNAFSLYKTFYAERGSLVLTMYGSGSIFLFSMIYSISGICKRWKIIFLWCLVALCEGLKWYAIFNQHVCSENFSQWRGHFWSYSTVVELISTLVIFVWSFMKKKWWQFILNIIFIASLYFWIYMSLFTFMCG